MFQQFPSPAMVFTGDSVHQIPMPLFFHKCHGSSGPLRASAWDIVGGLESPCRHHGDQSAWIDLAVVTIKTTHYRRRGDETAKELFRCPHC